MSELGTLRTVLATSPLTGPLKSGALGRPGFTFDFADVSPVHKAFSPMVRQQAYDLSELAIVTALQAVAFGRPIIVLPVVVASRFQRGCLITRRSGGVAGANDLPGKRIGVRAYTQTTGMWVRAHLAEDYGLATTSMHWLTRDAAHVEQYQDPPFVEHAADDKSLLDQLREGITDAAVLGNDLPRDEEFVPVIDDAGTKDHAWSARHGFMPVNHLVSASTRACERDPGAVRQAYSLLLESFTQVHAATGEPSPYVVGFDDLRKPVDYVIEACLEQGLLPRRLGIDEIFGPAEHILGGLPA